MQTTFVRVYLDCKDALDEAIRTYRRNTGKNITMAELIAKLIDDSEFKQLAGWSSARMHDE